MINIWLVVDILPFLVSFGLVAIFYAKCFTQDVNVVEAGE